ncbi:MAG TPA: cell division protein FtsZ [Candidatus Mcinerneyibacteriales bacterium]|nr:cell division protein FtsZ [Candidatus Mcinerneyibacteriota bacterium]HOO59614.1 cell division protein FtsZ [Candidatus Mcinerneyibacteriales bacterium]HPE20342.1 cell division protein FtsZ [Candidatus Mcinerneyibacteriales bacterium]
MISIERTDAERFNVRIKVFGIGGGGCNALNNMVGSGLLKGLDFVAVNTDLQVLDQNKARHKLAIGSKLTRGLGAGGNPEIGEKAASEDRDKIRDMIDGASLLFLTTGMGGGTGTGATPVIASVAREMGILTIAVVTKPFEFEGKSRMENAEKGIEGVKESADAVIVIPNQRLFLLQEGKISFLQAFRMVDNVLLDSVRGITELLDTAGVINVDFSDLAKVMKTPGDVFIGMGLGVGENKAVEAAQKAVECPLMEELSMEGAEEILVNVTTGQDFEMGEVERIVKVIEQKTNGYGNLKYGVVYDQDMSEEIKVTVIAKGFRENKKHGVDKLKEIAGKDVPLERLVLTNPDLPEFDTPAVFRRKAD